MGKYKIKEFIIETQSVQGDVAHVVIIPDHPCNRINPRDMKMVQEYIENIPADVARGSGKTRSNSLYLWTAPTKVIFHDPATIVFWTDGTKTVVKCQPGDTYSKEMGLALCFSKKMLGNQSNFNNEFKKWLPEE